MLFDWSATKQDTFPQWEQVTGLDFFVNLYPWTLKANLNIDLNCPYQSPGL